MLSSKFILLTIKSELVRGDANFLLYTLQRDKDSLKLAELQTLLSIRDDRIDEKPHTQA